ncbi:OmpA family protein [Pantoea sp. GbtcB22]|uniref:OmpA family protein n=1 Tax=Pantoea sp. GbtcB22 TaxID=2824767 RepID=UPI001C2F8A9F|nr:OmpA family protein [Pantoea sp. GbtcB22]
MKKLNSSLIAMVVAGGLFSLASHAAVESKVFGQTYQPVASVAASQAQIVYYRTSQVSGPDAAHVYVDGEYQSALLTGMYSTFCVSAGSHSLGAFLKDAPYYKGKEAQPHRDNFEGGKTYFVKVDSNSQGRPQLVNAQQANVELRGLRAQAHTLDRASAVEQCRYTASKTMDYTLSSDVLFAFGKSSRNDITGKGRDAVNELIGKLHKDGVQLNRIQVIGHTDPIGKAATNLRLGQQRANTVRTMLIQGGLPARNLNASSAGSDELVVGDCTGTRAEQIQCNAPNRRVVVRVQTQ